MAISVDNLEIEISASSQSAVKHIRELTKALEGLRKVTNKKWGDISDVFKKIRDMSDSAQLGDISGTTQKIRDFSDAIHELKDVTNGLRFNGLSKAIKNISRDLEPEARKIKNIDILPSDFSTITSEADIISSSISDVSGQFIDMAQTASVAASKLEETREWMRSYSTDFRDLVNIASSKDFSLVLRSLPSTNELALYSPKELAVQYTDVSDTFAALNRILSESPRTSTYLNLADELSKANLSALQLKNSLSFLQTDTENLSTSLDTVSSGFSDFQTEAKLLDDAINVDWRPVEEGLVEFEGYVDRGNIPIDMMKDSVLHMGGAMRATFAKIGSVVSPIVEMFGGKLKSAVSYSMNAISGLGKRIGGWLKDQIRKAVIAIADLSKRIISIPFNRMKSAISGVIKPLRTLIGAIGRIAFYRTIRRAIQMITGSLREGIQNLYQYSQTVGTDFHKSMDSIATDALYIKNSFASIAGPIIDALAPAIDYLTDKITLAMDRMAQFVAAVTGKTTYSSAIKVAQKYGDTISGIGDAAKEAKGNLIGIDELTILSDASTQDPSQMFNEVEALKDIDDFSKKIRDAFESDDWKELGQLFADKFNRWIEGIEWDKLGEWIGKGITGLYTTAYYFLRNIDFGNIGRNIARMVNEGIRNIDFDSLGRFFVRKFTALFDFLIGFIREFDFKALGGAIIDFVGGAFNEFYEWMLSKKDGLGESIAGKIVGDVLDMLVKMTEATLNWAENLNFEPLIKSLEFLTEKFEPLVKIVTDGLAWAYENVLLPFGKWTIEEALPATIELLGQAFDALAVLLESLQPVAKDFWDYTLKPMGEWTGKFIIKGLQELTDLLKDLADFLRGETSFKEFIGQLSNMQIIMISIATGVAIYKFSEALTTMFGPASIIGGVAGIIGGATLAITNFADMLRNGFNWVQEGLMLVGIAIAGVGAFILGAPALVAAVVAGIVAAVSTLVVVIHDNWDIILQALHDGWENIKQVGREIGDFWAGIGGHLADIWNQTVDEFWDGVEHLKEIPQEFIELGANIIQGLWDGITGLLGDAVGWLREHIFNPIVNGVKSLFGINSPSTVFAEIGDNLIAGLFNGISGAWHTITDFFGGAWEDLKSGFSNTWENIKSGASEKWNGITSTLSGAWDNVKSLAGEKFGDIKDTVSKSWNNAATESASNVKSLRTDAERELNALKTSATSISKTIDTETVNSWKDMKSGTINSISGLQTQISKTFTSIKTTIANVWNSVKFTTQSTLSTISGIVGNITGSISGAVSKIKSNLSDVVGKASTAFSSVQTSMSNIARDVESTIRNATSGISGLSVPGYASGGVARSGQLFMAREGGIPEYVGQFGNQTGIANNDQIVRGIASGVSEANEDVVNAIYAAATRIVNSVRENGGGSTNWNSAADTITKIQNRQARMSGRAVTYS